MKHGSIDVAGLRLAYSATTGSQPGALLIHGNSSSRASFATVLQHPIAWRRRLVALDLPGHGRSDRAAADDPERYTIPWYVRILTAAVAELGFSEGVLAGHSLGAHLLLHSVGEGGLPGVRGLFLQGLAPLSGPQDIPSAFPPSSIGAVLTAAAPGDEAVREALGELYGPHMAAPDQGLAAFRATDPEARPRLATGPISDEHALLRNLAIPVALVHADDDLAVNGAWLAAREAPTLWGGEIRTIPRCGHFAHEDRTDRYVALLESFLNDLG